MRILIAEDERITRRTLQRQLETWGHEVVAAEDGAQAWRRFGESHFDIVVTDWEMPGLDGRELIGRIRASGHAGYVYLIMLTGRAEKADIVAGMEAGADDYVGKPFDRDELRVRIRAGERIIELERSLAVQNEKLREVNERMSHDLNAAAKIQKDLLPSRLRETPGARFAWRYRPCDELAGDLLNIVPIDDGRVAMYIADVSGHGVASSLVAVSVHRNLSLRHDQTSLLLAGGDSGTFVPNRPRSVATQLNGIFPMDSNGGHFITLVYGVLDIGTGGLRYCCAGHQSPVIARRGEAATSFDVSSFPLGIAVDADYDDDGVDLKPGDRVYFYSDGVIEAADPSRKLFGLDRLHAVIDECRNASLDDSVGAVVEAASVWQRGAPFGDDVSVVAVEYEGA